MGHILLSCIRANLTRLLYKSYSHFCILKSGLQIAYPVFLSSISLRKMNGPASSVSFLKFEHIWNFHPVLLQFPHTGTPKELAWIHASVKVKQTWLCVSFYQMTIHPDLPSLNEIFLQNIIWASILHLNQHHFMVSLFHIDLLNLIFVTYRLAMHYSLLFTYIVYRMAQK